MNVLLIVAALIGALVLALLVGMFVLSRKLKKLEPKLLAAGQSLPAAGSYETARVETAAAFSQLGKPDPMAADLGYGGSMPHIAMHNPGYRAE